LEDGCRGCGGVIGNAIGSFSIVCFALGAISFVLLAWFGTSLALLVLIGFGLYKLFSKAKKPQPNAQASLRTNISFPNIRLLNKQTFKNVII
jgi:hypothetical protein